MSTNFIQKELKNSPAWEYVRTYVERLIEEIDTVEDIAPEHAVVETRARQLTKDRLLSLLSMLTGMECDETKEQQTKSRAGID